MTPRQQRRLAQKLALKAAKKQRTMQQASVPVGQPCLATRDNPVPPSISEAKLLANRANSQLSTGAISEAGKAIVSQNATKHGLTGKFNVLDGESQQDFDKLLAGFLETEQPADQEEIEMVHAMAEATWLSRRAVRLQDRCIPIIESGTPAEQKQAERQLALYLRYMTTHDRAYSRYSTELRKRRNERARVERGFVSQKYKEAAECRRKEAHEMRQAIQNVKQEAREIRNRIAAAKAEALELKNEEKQSAQTLAAAA